MKEFLEYLIKEIATKPEEARVEEVEENGVYIYQVHVAEEDMGVIIGKEGRNIKSLRNLAKTKAIKDNIRIQIVLEETSPKPGGENSSETENEDD